MHNDFLVFSDLTDAELIRLVQNKNEKAFAELMSRWTPWIRGVIVTNSRQRRDVEEIHTDIWVAVWQNIRELRKIDSFSAWLHRIAYNACKRYYTLARQSRTEIPHQESVIIENIDQYAAARYREAQLITDVKEVIHYLPEKVRSVAELFYLESWSIKEISEEFNLAIGTVKTKLREIRKLLRAEFDAEPIRGAVMHTKYVESHSPIQIETDKVEPSRIPAVFNVVSSDSTGNTWALPEGAIVRFGKGNMGDVKLLPNSNYFAVGTTIGIWWYDVSSMLPISLWKPYIGNISSFDFSHDGKWIIIDTLDDIIMVLDVQSGERVMQIKDQDGFGGIACSTNGKWVATAGGDGVIKVLDVHEGKCIAQMDRGKHEWKSNDVRQLEFSPDGELLAATVDNPECFSDDEQLLNPDAEGTQTYVWKPETGEPIIKFAGRDYMFSSDSHLLAAASMDESRLDEKRVDRSVSVWDVTTRERIAHFTGHDDWIDAVTISPCNQFVASSSRDGTLRVWNLENESQIMEYPNFEYPFYTRDGKLFSFIYVYSSKMIEVWDVEKREQMLEIEVGIGGYDFAKSLAITKVIDLLNEHEKSPSTISSGSKLPQYKIQSEPDFPNPSPLINWVDDQTLTCSRMGYSIQLWDVKQKCQSNRLLADKWIYHYTILNSGNILALEIDGNATVWDSNKTQKSVIRFSLPSDWTSEKIFDPNGNYLAAGRKDGNIYVWNLKQSSQSILSTGHSDEINSLAFSADGCRLVSSACDKSVRVFDLLLGEEIAILPMNTPCSPLALAYSPCGKLIAGELDQEIRLWCAKEFTTKLTITQGKVYRRTFPLVFSPCGKYLAGATWWQAGRENLTIRIWEVSTGEQIHSLQGHNSFVRSLAFSPNGSMLASGCSNGTILVWDLNPYL